MPVCGGRGLLLNLTPVSIPRPTHAEGAGWWVVGDTGSPLEDEGDAVEDVEEGGEEDAGKGALPEGHAEEGEGGAVVHGVVRHGVGEGGDALLHEDAEVVAEVGARDPEAPHGGEDEDLACRLSRGKRRERRVGGPVGCGRGCWVACLAQFNVRGNVCLSECQLPSCAPPSW